MLSEELRQLIEDKLKFMRFELYDIKYVHAGKHSILRIFIDKPGGVNIDDCERASNEISMLLDVENFSQNTPYTLEVSSPGADRTLTSQRDFQLVIGHFVKLEVKDDAGVSEEVVGRLEQCKEGAVTLELDDETMREIPMERIARGALDIRFK
jgi:ribosome maturation factor RimP